MKRFSKTCDLLCATALACNPDANPTEPVSDTDPVMNSAIA